MTYTYEDLKGMTIAELREVARGLQPGLQGYTQMNKEHLLPAICQALGIDTHHHHPRHHHEPAETLDKSRTRSALRMLKAERDKALEAHDSDTLHRIRRHMHSLKRRLRVMAD